MFKRSRLVALAGLLALSAPALAVPPEMTAIAFPVDIDSIVENVGLAGGTALLAWAIVWVGFRLVKTVLYKSTSSVTR